MSLKVWLPLNGNLNNQGISDLQFTAASANTSIDTNGKIGSCYTNNSRTAGGLISDTTIDLGINQSMFCWVNFTTLYSGSNLGAGLVSQHRYSSNRGMGLTIKYVSATTGYLSVNTGNGSSRTFNTYCATTLMNAGTWYHVGYTYDGANIKLYVNGVCEKTQAYTGMSVPAEYLTVFCWSLSGTSGNTLLADYKLQGKLNDVRVYDHCLSLSEVKEISQGLILHYKLDSFFGGYGNPNLYTGSKDFSGSWVNGNNWTTSSETYAGFTVKQRSATWGGLAQNITCTQNDIFTVSFYAKVDSGGQIMSIHRSSLGNVTTGLSILGGNFSSTTNWVTTNQDGTQWKRYWATVQITSADITYLQWRIENNQSGKNLYVCGMKLEKGSSHTGWSPAASENSFNIIQDSSGYGHNGEVLGTLNLSTDTPRYSHCAIFNGTNTRIKVPNLTPEAITVSFWMKRGANTGTRQFMYTAWTGVTCELQTGGAPTFAVNRSSYPTIVGSAITVDSGWVHYCGTFDTINGLKLYQNGVLKSSNSTLTPIVWNITTNYIGYYNTYYNGLMSDFRIYCTALSSDDVLALYHTATKIDNSGKLHTFESIENLSNIIFKIDSARTVQTFSDGLSRYTQANCQVTLTDQGYHIYRPPNTMNASNGGANNMWGGLKLVNQSSDTVAEYNSTRDNIWGLQQGHTYLFAFHAKGQSSNSPSLNAQSNMGWDRIAGVGPNPTYIASSTIPANFNGEKDCYLIFTIGDTIIKTATETKGGYTTDLQYLSYRHLSLNYGYTNTGELGTDLYLTDFRLYDVTNYFGKIQKTGITNFSDYVERNGILQIRKKAELLTNNLIER